VKKYLFLILTLLICQINLAQKITIVDLFTGKPIENAKIFNGKGSITEYSNKNGEVSISEFKLEDKIYVSHSSYETEILTITKIIQNNYIISMINRTLPDVIILPKREYSLQNYNSVRIDKIGKMKDLKNPQTTADMLQNGANIMVQKSQAGGGSPIIRGFEANKILLVVDGIRMNNAIYRSGHLQNAITVDNNILESTDIFYGPGSVIYGSDALGGVIHFHTKNPILSRDSNAKVVVNYLSRFGTANGENTNHVDINYGRKKWGSLTSFTFSNFENMKMGGNRYHKYVNFGKINHFVKTENGKDSIYDNPNKNIHPRTGYSQLDLAQKITYSLSENKKLGLNIQYSTSSNINRFDKLNEYRNNRLKYAEWYYGPQKRLLTALKYEDREKCKLFDYYAVITGFQKIDEDRVSRQFNSIRKFIQEEDVNVYSLNADFLKQLSSKEVIYYGVEGTHNTVKSVGIKENILTQTQTQTFSRYPNNGSEISSAAAYVTMDKSLSKNFTFNLGGRYSHFFNRSAFLDTFNFGFPFANIAFNDGALSGSFSLKYKEKHGFSSEIIGSSGFRSPNVDDYGKIFEKGGILVVPNVNLKSEHVKTAEINFSKKWEKDEKEYLVLKLAGFYTRLTDAIVRKDFTINGKDSIVFNGDKVKIQANQNVNSAEIYGGSFDMKINFTTYLSFAGSINYTLGKSITYQTPLPHIPPTFGRLSLTYLSNKTQIQIRSLFNGNKRLRDFSPGKTDNPEEATIDGSPAWQTFSVTGSYKIWKQLKIQASVENIFDVHYKQFASGISGMGRNFVFSISGKF